MRWSTVPALVLSALLSVAGCSSGDDDPSHGPGHDTSGEVAVDANRADVMFATMMIPHHEQAIEMSDVLLAKDGVDPEVAALAREIKAAQAPEIEQMRRWLADWDAGTHHGGTGGHGGMMSGDDMRALESAQGEQATRLFLTGMIEHHEGAIDMAIVEERNGENAQARELARTIVRTQATEIDRMRALLRAS